MESDRILVTGGTGFLGRHVCRVLRDAGAAVRAVGRRDADLTDGRDTLDLFRVERPSVVIHLAADIGGVHANAAHPARFMHANALMGLHVLDAARRTGVRHVVNAGTAAAYPSHAPVPFREDDLSLGPPDGATWAYGAAKRLVQEAGRAFGDEYGLPVTSLLFTNLYGPGDHFGDASSHVVAALLPRFLQAAREGRDPVDVWGSGRATRDFLFVEDGARAVALAVEKGVAGVFNVGSGRETSIRELAEALARVTGFTGGIRWLVDRPEGVPRKALDGSRAREELGFEPVVALEEGLGRTADWLRSPGQ